MKERKTIKICIGYHKPCKLFKSEICIPVNGGREILQQPTKDGIFDRLDTKWLLNNTVGDNTGENISKYNRYLNEMTVIYWMWKNYDKLGNPDYIGFMQYGKHLIFNPYMEISRQEWIPHTECYIYDLEQYVKQDNFNENYILSAIGEYDCVCAAKLDIKTGSQKATTCRERMDELSDGMVHVFDIMSDTIKKKYPAYKKQLSQIENGSVHYPLNVFVMRKEIFFKYCEFIFGVLFEVLKKIDLTNATPVQKRAPGFCSEFLTSMFISRLEKTYKVKELKTAVLVDAIAMQMRTSISPQSKTYEEIKRKILVHRVLRAITFGNTRKRHNKRVQYYKNKLK